MSVFSTVGVKFFFQQLAVVKAQQTAAAIVFGVHSGVPQMLLTSLTFQFYRFVLFPVQFYVTLRNLLFVAYFNEKT